MLFLRQSTAVDVPIGPFVDDGDGFTALTSLTISQADVRLKKNNGNWAQVNDNTSATHEENGWYEKELDATDTNTVGTLVIAVAEGGALPVWHEFTVLEEAVYDMLFAASALGYIANAPVNVAQISADGGAADNLETMLDGGGGGTLSLGNLAIVSASGTAMTVTGQGAGSGIAVTGGATSGTGIAVTGGATGGKGVAINGTGTGTGLEVVAGATGIGATIAGGATSGYGMDISSPTSGIGLHLLGGGSGGGLSISGGSTGVGALIAAGGGNTAGLTILGSGSGNGIGVAGGATGRGLTMAGGITSGDAARFVAGPAGIGINVIGGSTSGDALSLTATGTGEPLNVETVQQVVDGVWDETIADHVDAGTTGEALDDAGGSGASAADIADAVWDEATAGHTTSGTFGEQLKTDVDAILTDTDVIGTPSNLGGGATVAANLSDIEGQTDDIGAAGAGLTALATAAELAKVPKSDSTVTWNATAAAQIQTEATDALNAYDPPTRAELTTDTNSILTAVDAVPTTAELATALAAADDAVLAAIAALNNLSQANIRTAVGLASANLDTQLDALPTATENADALLKRDFSAVTGEATRSALNALRFLRNKWAISGGTLTVTKEDDSTSAWTGAVATTAGDPVSSIDPA